MNSVSKVIIAVQRMVANVLVMTLQDLVKLILITIKLTLVRNVLQPAVQMRLIQPPVKIGMFPV